MTTADLFYDHDRDPDRLQLRGALTVKTARRLYDRTPRFRPGEMRLDLASVSEADSAGLALLLHWANLAQNAHGRLTFTNAPPQLREIAKITNLAELFGA